MRHKFRDSSAKLPGMNLYRAFLFGVACVVSVSAFAQWQWIDKQGRKVFSDRPPPIDTPEKNILKQPVGRTKASTTPLAAVATPADAAASAPRTGAIAPKLSGKDKELEEKKKQAEDAEAAKKKAEEAKLARAKAENCTRAKQSKASFDSGVRIARTNDKGEREIMDDAARATETQRIQSIITSDCQ